MDKPTDQDEDFKPTRVHLKRLWKLLSPRARSSRLANARQKEAGLLAVERAMAKRGLSEREAIRQKMPWSNRSSYRRWKKLYDKHGFQGLIDGRMPLKNEEMSAEVRQEICALRRLDPEMAVEKIVEHVEKHFSHQTSPTTVKRVLHDAGLSRRPGPRPGMSQAGETRLELGGMKLVEAALQETGYLDVLTGGVIARRESMELPEPALPVDLNGRDALGRFESEYNERYRKEPNDDLGPGFLSVDLKRVDKDPRQMHLLNASEELLKRKLKALLVSPLLGSGRWDGIRVPRGDLLGELCGYPYMPSTLDLFTRELKYMEVSPTLWEIHARLLHAQTAEWGDPKRVAVIFIDETNKPVWTELFAQSTRVSSVGRVMPGIEQVAFHTGYGVPLRYVTCSGRTPLVNVVPELLDELEGWLEGAEIGRIVVIDAEANSVPFLRGLEQGEQSRAWVTRLRSSWMKGKRIFNRGNYRAYRNGDRVRMGEADFPGPEKSTFRMRVVEVERRTTGKVTYLGASMLLDPKEWKAATIADLYFDRWPCQEADFRAVSQAVGLKDVHGYGKQLVDNVSVVRKIDKLDQRIIQLKEKEQEKLSAIAELGKELHEEQKQARRINRKVETVREHLEQIVASENLWEHNREISKGTEKLQQLNSEAIPANASCLKKEALVNKHQEQLNRVKEKLGKLEETQAVLSSRRRIYRHDVELDGLFALLKVGLTFLVTYVLREYLREARMAPVTFLERVATLPARLRMTPTHEILTFEYNHRDPDVMEYLRRCVDTINARELKMESGRRLRVKMDPAPRPRRPPPRNQRAKPGDRFERV